MDKYWSNFNRAFSKQTELSDNFQSHKIETDMCKLFHRSSRMSRGKNIHSVSISIYINYSPVDSLLTKIALVMYTNVARVLTFSAVYYASMYKIPVLTEKKMVSICKYICCVSFYYKVICLWIYMLKSLKKKKKIIRNLHSSFEKFVWYLNW